MNRLFQILCVLLLASSPSWATWALVNQTHSHFAGGGTGTQSWTIPATGTGHLLMFIVSNENNTVNMNVNSVNDNQSGNWSICLNCNQGTGHGGGTLGAAYCLSTISGTTSITITMSNTSSYWIDILEYSANTPITFDSSASSSDAACTSCSGLALTLTSTADLVIEGIVNTSSTDTVTAISPSVYNTPFLATAYNVSEAVAGWPNTGTTTMTAPTWTQSSSHSVGVVALAFTEASTGVNVFPKSPVVF